MRLNTLLGDSLGDTLRIMSLELVREKITKPTFKKRYNTAHEEKPAAPAGGPEADTGTLANGTSIEAIVDEVLQVLRHLDLPHKLVLVTVHTVTVHTRKGADVRKYILEGIGKLKRVNISKPILDMGVDDKLCQVKNFSTQVESIPKTRLLPLFRSKRPKS